MAYRIPKDLADRMSAKRRPKSADGYVRETFTQSRAAARQTARAFLDQYPKDASMPEV